MNRICCVCLIVLIITPLTQAAASGVYTLNSGTATETSITAAPSSTDQSGIYVYNSGNLTVGTINITSSGGASNTDNSCKYGINAGVLAGTSSTKGTVAITGTSNTITTTGSAANGLFATYSGSSISMAGGTIICYGGNAHGVDVTYGGSISLTNVDITTYGASSSAVATDYGGGTVTVNGGTIIAGCTQSDGHSAGIYSTGTITVSNATVSSVTDCGGVIDGANGIYLANTSLTGCVEGIKIWKTAPATGSAVVVIDGGSLTTTSGDGFYVTGTTGNAATATLTVKNGATVNPSNGNILNVNSSSTAAFNAGKVTLTGNLVADSTSTITASLASATTLTGTASKTAMTIDSNSIWNVTGSSTLTSLSNSGTVAFADSSAANTISGAYTQASTGTLSILLGGDSTYNKLAVTGKATLAGTLDVQLDGDYLPAVGQTFTIITRGSASGSFASVTTSPYITCSVAYNTTSVVITITSVRDTLADFDYDGDVDYVDLKTLTDAWLGSSDVADIEPEDGDGIVNFLDFASFALDWQ
jgi:hypothetical protein